MTLRSAPFASIALLALMGCRKDADPVSAPVTTAGIQVAYTFAKGGVPYTLDSTITDSVGHKVRFTTVRFLSACYQLTDDAHQVVAAFPTSCVLADASTPDIPFTVGTLEAQHTHGLMLYLGLDSVRNHADPAACQSAPLNDPAVHWGWDPAVGYPFLVLEGRVDADGDGIVDLADPPVVYRCATDAMRVAAAVQAHNDLRPGTTAVIRISVDMDRLLRGIDVLACPTAVGGGPVNLRLMRNLSVALATN